MKTREELLNSLGKSNGYYDQLQIFQATDVTYTKQEVRQVLSAPTKEQLKCDYCHAPFLDLSGKTEDELDQFDPDGAYCGLGKDSTITYGSPGDGFDGQGRDAKINFCPMCGRKLGDE